MPDSIQTPLFSKNITGYSNKMINVGAMTNLSFRYEMSNVLFFEENGTMEPFTIQERIPGDEHKYLYKNARDEQYIVSVEIVTPEVETSESLNINRKNYIKRCKKNNTLTKRNSKIEDQIKQNGEIEDRIKREIVKNLNFKHNIKRHYNNLDTKLFTKCNGDSVFLWNYYKIKEPVISKLIEYIRLIFDISDLGRATDYLDYGDYSRNKYRIETLFMYFSLSKIIDNLRQYTSVLKSSIEMNTKDRFNMNHRFCMNDVIKGRVVIDGPDISNDPPKFIEQIHIGDCNTLALRTINGERFQTMGYTLRYSKSEDGENKWTIFPTNAKTPDQQSKILDESLGAFKNTIIQCNSVNFSIFEQELDNLIFIAR